MIIPLDIRLSLRLLVKNWRFVTICGLVIGLGMGLSITIYSLLTNIGPKSLPFIDGDKFVNVRGIDRSSGGVRVLPLDGYIYQSLESSVNSYSAFGAYTSLSATFSDGDVAEQFLAASITPELMNATKISPILGRGLSLDDDLLGAEPVVVISYRLWRDYYVSREDIIGISSRINGKNHTVIGVMPEEFTFPFVHDLWLPLQLPSNLQPTEWGGLQISGVLNDEASIESASAEVDVLMSQLRIDESEYYGSYEAVVQIFGTLASTAAPDILPLIITISLVLLVCLNVANLILVRTNERVQEFAIYSSLGANRWRLVRIILGDSLLICIVGSLVGILWAELGMRLLGAAMLEMMPGPMPFWIDFGWELNVVITTLMIILLIWLVSAGLAIWQVIRQDLSTLLAGGVSASTDSRSPIGTKVLVSIEMIFSCLLLILGGVFIGVSNDLANVDYGTETEGYLSARVTLSTDEYRDKVSQESYRSNLEQELLRNQGIDAVSFSTALPAQYGLRSSYALEDRNLIVDGQYPLQDVIYVAANYFETMGVELREGRLFDGSDSGNSLPVVIVEELFADQMWPGQSAIGKRIQLKPDSQSSLWLTIVGVVPHIVQRLAFDGINELSLYRPLTQIAVDDEIGRSFSVVAKLAGSLGSIDDALRESAVRVDRDIPIMEIILLTDVIEGANALVNFSAKLFFSIAFVTMILAITGIYALISRSVYQRKREIGIRRALGSTNNHVLRVFIIQGLKYLGLGLVIGGGSAVLISNFMDGLLPGTTKWVPFVFSAVGLGMGLLVFFSTYNSARPLVLMEPGDTLRND